MKMAMEDPNGSDREFKVEIRRITPDYQILVSWVVDGVTHVRVTGIEPYLDGDVDAVLDPRRAQEPSPVRRG